MYAGKLYLMRALGSAQNDAELRHLLGIIEHTSMSCVPADQISRDYRVREHKVSPGRTYDPRHFISEDPWRREFINAEEAK